MSRSVGEHLLEKSGHLAAFFLLFAFGSRNSDKPSGKLNFGVAGYQIQGSLI